MAASVGVDVAVGVAVATNVGVIVGVGVLVGAGMWVGVAVGLSTTAGSAVGSWEKMAVGATVFSVTGVGCADIGVDVPSVLPHPASTTTSAQTIRLDVHRALISRPVMSLALVEVCLDNIGTIATAQSAVI